MRVSYDEMKREFIRILSKKGFKKQAAEEASTIFVENSCDGVYSHGVNRFPRVVEYIDKGYIKTDAELEKIGGFGAIEQWDGNLGMGNLNAKRCMERTTQLASKHGIGCVALKNTNHWMRGGAYGWQAAKAGFIGICWTNTIPNMPAWGAEDRRIGNNPLIMAVPRVDGPIVVDMAMSQFSYGKIEEYKLNGAQLPVAGGFDTNGEISTDPKEIEKTWRVLPAGFWKGASLSIVLDLIASSLSGGNSTEKIGELGDEYAVSQIFIAIDPRKLGDKESQERTLNETIDYIKSSIPLEEGGEVYYPGERSKAIRADNLANGIPVDEAVWGKITAI